MLGELKSIYLESNYLGVNVLLIDIHIKTPSVLFFFSLKIKPFHGPSNSNPGRADRF